MSWDWSNLRIQKTDIPAIRRTMHWLKRLETNIELKHQYQVSILFVHINRHTYSLFEFY